ncbi:ABC transporter ATP-binding protein [Noviherbaspirillum sedimenti]|uniref:ABC transporter ATP-binding protein n=1 Tax=Noviherbaspirillum sedimenti TaxID=2320865 RepID=A0A3A3GJW1_9BURK|nr:ABC transporter ATP-binding protein [Noviherbaspirillum sedimenti]RJG02586.1 ABC transporter ATP-binding protein [Noviherbaspirillum sedimenti]
MSTQVHNQVRPIALSLRDVNKSFGEAHIIRGVNLELFEGERHAIIGPNGAGKSTVFHLISGQFKPSSGEIRLGQQLISGLPAEKINHLGLARSFQITNIFPKLSVYENLRLGVMQRFGMQYTLWRPIAGYVKVRELTEQLLEQVRLTRHRDTLGGELSYSEQRSLEIGMTLASDPKVLLLDEPMAGMSREETDYTVDLLRELTAGRTLMIVEHDMDVVFSLCDRISVLVYGQVVATDTPENIRNNKQVQEAYLGTEVAA